ncbi:MAG TPA: hypothetical protein VGE01_05835 [Fimbriimonas sp.]
MSRPDVFNTHIHLPPNFSAFNTVDEALDQAAAEGCVLLGASNYYDFSVYEPFVSGARERGIHPSCGIEILCRDEVAAKEGVRYNDPANPGKVYLCGKGLVRWKDPTPRAKELLSRIRRADEARMAEMAERLQSEFGGGPDAGTIVARVAERHGVPAETVVLQERHLAQAYAEASGQDATEIRSRLMKAGRPAFVEESYVSLEEGIELVRELGGIPAYPFVADGMNPVSERERDLPALIERLQERGIHAAEFISSRNSPEVLADYVLKLWSEGFPVTCGTEHNTGERMPLLPRCKDGSPIPEPVMEVFWKSALKIKEHESNARP